MCVRELVTYEYDDSAIRQPYLTLCANSAGSKPCADLKIIDHGVHIQKESKPSRTIRALGSRPHQAGKSSFVETQQSAESSRRAESRHGGARLSVKSDYVLETPLAGGHWETLPKYRTHDASRNHAPPSPVSSDGERGSSMSKRSFTLRRGLPTPPSSKNSSVEKDVQPLYPDVPQRKPHLPSLSKSASLESLESAVMKLDDYRRAVGRDEQRNLSRQARDASLDKMEAEMRRLRADAQAMRNTHRDDMKPLRDLGNGRQHINGLEKPRVAVHYNDRRGHISERSDHRTNTKPSRRQSSKRRRRREARALSLSDEDPAIEDITVSSMDVDSGIEENSSSDSRPYRRATEREKQEEERRRDAKDRERHDRSEGRSLRGRLASTDDRALSRQLPADLGLASTHSDGVTRSLRGGKYAEKGPAPKTLETATAVRNQPQHASSKSSDLENVLAYKHSEGMPSELRPGEHAKARSTSTASDRRLGLENEHNKPSSQAALPVGALAGTQSDGVSSSSRMYKPVGTRTWFKILGTRPRVTNKPSLQRTINQYMTKLPRVPSNTSMPVQDLADAESKEALPAPIKLGAQLTQFAEDQKHGKNRHHSPVKIFAHGSDRSSQEPVQQEPEDEFCFQRTTRQITRDDQHDDRRHKARRSRRRNDDHSDDEHYFWKETKYDDEGVASSSSPYTEWTHQGSSRSLLKSATSSRSSDVRVPDDIHLPLEADSQAPNQSIIGQGTRRDNLARALAAACDATEYDDKGNDHKAIFLYSEACSRLEADIDQEKRESIRERLDTIRKAYTDRIAELKARQIAIQTQRSNDPISEQSVFGISRLQWREYFKDNDMDSRQVEAMRSQSAEQMQLALSGPTATVLDEPNFEVAVSPLLRVAALAISLPSDAASDQIPCPPAGSPFLNDEVAATLAQHCLCLNMAQRLLCAPPSPQPCQQNSCAAEVHRLVEKTCASEADASHLSEEIRCAAHRISTMTGDRGDCTPRASVITAAVDMFGIASETKSRVHQHSRLTDEASDTDVCSFNLFVKLQNAIRNACSTLTTTKVPLGYKRVDWTCQCGLEIYDDYIELRPGSLEKLRSELRCLNPARTCSRTSDYPSNAMKRPQTSATQPVEDSTPGSRDLTFSKSSQTWPQMHCDQTTAPTSSAVSSSSSQLPLSQRGSSPLSDCERGQGSQAQPHVSTKNAHGTVQPPSHLILGYPFSTLATRIEQPEMSNVASDREFFKTLKSQYLQLRGTVSRRLFSLKSLVDMRFVQLELLDTSLAQIRKEDDIPPPELCANMCAAQSSSDLYTYNPAPADFVPPIGKRTLMHLLEHPQVANGCASVLFERVPRKLNQKLQVCPQKGYSVGWGIQYVEGLSKERIFVAGFVCCIISTITGVVYSAVQSDVQGGFGIAAYMMMVLVFLLGSAQVVLDR